MALLEIPWKPSPRELRWFAALQFVFLAVVAGMLQRHVAQSWIVWLVLAVSAAIAVVGIAVPRAVRMVFVAWMAVAFPIGWVVSYVVLAAVFYLVFCPIGLALKLCGHDPLQRRFDRRAASYWSPRPRSDDKSRYFRQF
jgi:hypothetical protein